MLLPSGPPSIPTDHRHSSCHNNTRNSTHYSLIPKPRTVANIGVPIPASMTRSNKNGEQFGTKFNTSPLLFRLIPDFSPSPGRTPYLDSVSSAWIASPPSIIWNPIQECRMGCTIWLLFSPRVCVMPPHQDECTLRTIPPVNILPLRSKNCFRSLQLQLLFALC